MPETATEFEPRVGQALWMATQCPEGQSPPARVSYTPTPSPGYIVGQVLDAHTGDPVQEVSISAEGLETDSFAETITDAVGRFKVGPLQVEDGYTIVASAPQHSYRLWRGIALPEQGQVQNFALERSGNVQGVVQDAQGNAIADATVLLVQEDSLRWGEGEATTDTDGFYCFCRVDVDADTGSSLYSLLALHPEYTFAQEQVQVSPSYSSTNAPPLAMPPKSSIQGIVKVNGSAHEGVLVSICSDEQGLPLQGLSALTNSQGHFSIKVDGNNTYQLLVQGDQTEVANREVPVAPGQDASPQPEIDLRGPGSIRGIVRNLSGQSVEDLVIEVSLQDEDGDDLVASSMMTASDGSYQFDFVPPTPPNRFYTMRAWQPLGEDYRLFAQATGVVVTPDTETLVDLRSDTY